MTENLNLPLNWRLERFRAKWTPVRVKKTRQNKRLEPGSDSIRTDKALVCKPFGEFDEDAPIGRIFDFSECDDEPQTFDDVEIDLIIPNQP
jgi:hypothetical protein